MNDTIFTDEMARQSKLPLDQTTFQCYDPSSGTIDYTEKKIILLVRLANNVERKLSLINLLKDYKAGRAVVAWKKGEPIWVITGNNKKPE